MEALVTKPTVKVTTAAVDDRARSLILPPSV